MEAVKDNWTNHAYELLKKKYLCLTYRRTITQQCMAVNAYSSQQKNRDPAAMQSFAETQRVFRGVLFLA